LAIIKKYCIFAFLKPVLYIVVIKIKRIMKIKSLTFGTVFLFLFMSSFSQQKPATTTTPATQQKPATTTTPATQQKPATTTAPATQQRPVPAAADRTTSATANSPVSDADRAKQAEADAIRRVAEDGEVLEMRELHLPPAERGGGRPLMEVLNQRQSIRRFSPRELEPHFISNLLWAANGVNRDADKDDETREVRAATVTTADNMAPAGNTISGKRTAPSARDAREIDIYVVTAHGVYLYIPDGHTIKNIKRGDFRREILGSSAFAHQAPIVLVYVANAKKMEKFDPATKDIYAAVDCGFISQNVYLYCASEHLATVILGTFSKETVIKVLGLKNDKVMFVQPVGHRD
jgi:SagB-type dehydrogenase family enzyme